MVTIELCKSCIKMSEYITDKYLSVIADVSEKTYRMGAKILKSDNSTHTIKLLRRNGTNENSVKNI